ncbi:adenosylcobinamide-phosphate synthase CbiB [Profundibacterium mesophilum]|uniref:Cobalamin biosynthesis protein CobD n=1 Tax=Profundibacterium mesophilum KAUST100406-0324 TaxID=1037889 RepID=A0A921NQF9_9RHOB|nr:adenosylcobinamide-phosphate synthase CbiB [Profundibacterium mesophilum]KAF0675515.1 Adenosylcobinamide-phosphate synthase [Profundibacterium mesophilum KAUST100406-0324]
MSHAAVLLGALLLDALLGEPRWLWSRLPHPAVLMGRAIDLADRRFNRGGMRRAKGALLLALGAAGALAAGRVIGALGWPAEMIVAAILLAQRSLADHVGAVASALSRGLPEGRRAVSMIVGRETSTLNEAGVSRAAIESGAENLADGVIAPALWFALGGLPGMLLYKLVNTADSMIGHLTPRHARFGWAAARLDDVMNWPAARLTALLIAVSHGRPGLWPAIRREAPRHRSPNAGWPEAAMAHVLDVALSGPRTYGGELRDEPFVHPSGRRDPGRGEITRSVAALWRSWALFALAVTLVSFA